MARRRRHFTVGRAFALLILGIGVGAVLYIGRHTRPDALKGQLAEVLADVLAPGAEYKIDDIALSLDGVTLSGIRVLYPDAVTETAIGIERVELTVDHAELLGGEVNILQVDVFGLVVRLRADPARGGIPELPGVFRAPGVGDSPLPDRLPEVHVHPGDGGSHVEVLDSDLLDEGVPLRLTCRSATAASDGPLYRLIAEFEGEKLTTLGLEIVYDPARETLTVDGQLEGLAWNRDDIELLEPGLRASLPPVEVGGEADIREMRAKVRLEPFALLSAHGTAEMRALRGSFGNVHTGDPAGLPFGLRDGTCALEYRDGVLDLKDFRAVYDSPAGEAGELRAGLHIDFAQVEPWLDFTLEGTIPATTDDMRLLLPPDAVEAIVEQFLPAGTFDFELAISQRPALPERLVAQLNLSKGRFNYAGQLDELTGKRFGFRYPLSRASADIRIQTHVESARGHVEVVTIRDLEGFSPVAEPEKGVEDVAVRARGDVRIYDIPGDVHREDVDIEIVVDDLPIDKKLTEAFASTPRGTPYRQFDLSGWADRVSIRVERDAWLDNEARATYDVTLRDCSMAYEDFPLRLEDVSGHIVSRDHLPDPRDNRYWRVIELKSLEGRAKDGGRVTGRGLISQGDDGTEELELFIDAEDLVIGPDLENAIARSPVAKSGLLGLWRQIRPHGRLDVHVELPAPNEIELLIDLAGTTSLRGFGDVDCPATGLTGHIRYEAGVVEFEDVAGRLAETPFYLSGEVRDGGAFDIEAGLTDLVLEPAIVEVAAALVPESADIVERLDLAPESSLHLGLRCRCDGEGEPVRVSSTLDDLDFRSGLFGLDLAIRGGPVVIDPRRVTAGDLWLRAGDGEVFVRELAWPRVGGRGWAVLEANNLEPVGHLDRIFGSGFAEIMGFNLRLDLKGFRVEYNREDLTVILSGAADLRRHRLLDEPVDALEPTGALGLNPITLRLPETPGGPLRFSGVVEYNSVNLNLPVDVQDLSGELRVADGTLAPEFTMKGAILGGELTTFDRYLDDLSSNLTFEPHYLRLGNVEGRLYQGKFLGDIEVHLTDPRAFRVRLRATGVELGEMLAEEMSREDPMSGTMDVALELESPGGDLQDMFGRGEIRVREGQLFRVPGVRRLLAVLSRATPLSRANRFQAAEADFTIEGETIDVSRIHLSTKLNDVYGRGEMTIFGDLDLVIEPQVTRAIDLPRFINLPVLSTLRDLWHKTAYEIRLVGTIDSPALRLRGLPFLRKKARPFTQSRHAGRAETRRPRLLP